MFFENSQQLLADKYFFAKDSILDVWSYDFSSIFYRYVFLVLFW